MSKRLQVVLDEVQYRELRRLARRIGMTVSEWVRQALRSTMREQPAIATETKLAAVRAAIRHEFPTGEISKMLAEIEQGHLDRETR